MNIPQSLPVYPLDVGGAAAATPSNPLAFTMQGQAQTLWCWAACAVSVNIFLNQSGFMKQCDFVNMAFPGNDCCNNGSSSQCNVTNDMEKALRLAKVFGSHQGGSASILDVMNAIDAQTPLVACIQWINNNAGHVVCIYGYSGSDINIADPWGPSTTTIDFNLFPQMYSDSGNSGATWQDTYWVAKQ